MILISRSATNDHRRLARFFHFVILRLLIQQHARQTEMDPRLEPARIFNPLPFGDTATGMDQSLFGVPGERLVLVFDFPGEELRVGEGFRGAVVEFRPEPVRSPEPGTVKGTAIPSSFSR